MPYTQKIANYFNFAGGLNTDLGVLNTKPNQFLECKNVVLNKDASSQRRKGVDFIHTDVAGNFMEPSPTITHGGAPQRTTISGKIWSYNYKTRRYSKLVIQEGDIFKIYDPDPVALANFDAPQQEIGLGCSKYVNPAKTRLKQNENKLFYANKFLKPGYLQQTADGIKPFTIEPQVRSLDYKIYIAVSNNSNKIPHRDVEKGSANWRLVSESLKGALEEDTDEEKIAVTVEDASGFNVEDVVTCVRTTFPTLITEGSGEILAVESNTIIIKVITGEFLVNYSLAKFDDEGKVLISSLIQSVIDLETDASEWDALTDYTAGEIVKSRWHKVDLFEDYTISNTLEDNRYPGALEFYSGRLWLSASAVEPNKVWFSQVILKDDDYTRFYQEADPNDIQDPAVVADDGGVITISGADEILNIAATQYSLVVLAKNGVWEITGADGIFDATSYAIRKVSDFGLISPDAFVVIDNTVIYLHETGVYVLGRESDIAVSSSIKSLSNLTIDNLLTEIPKTSKQIAKMHYDEKNKKIYLGLNYSYTDDFDYNFLITANKIKDFLVYDLDLKAWYFWRIREEDTSVNGIAINELFTAPSGSLGSESLLYTLSDEVITTDSGENVITYRSNPNSVSDILLCVFSYIENGTNYIGYGLLQGNELVDFSKEPEFKSYYKSRIGSAHQTYQDIMRSKKPVYLTSLFKRTEVDDNNVHGIDKRKSSCRLRVSADFADNALLTTDSFGEPFISNPDYGKSYEVYPKNRTAISFLGNKSAGYSHNMSQHRVAGKGNVLQFNFEDGDEVRYFKCLSNGTTSSPIVDTDNWEEIEPDDTLNEWDENATYSSGNSVKVTLVYDFHLIGWACKIVATQDTEV